MTTRLALLLFCLSAASPAIADESAGEQSDDTTVTAGAEVSSADYRGGSIRIGAFAINNIDARAYFGPDDIPLRGVIDLESDLGIKDSVVAARVNFMYRFSKHHAASVGYYKLDLDGIVRLGRTIELGDTQFDIGLDLRSHYEEQITKVAYNFVFHDEGRVMLSVKPGLHFSKARLSLTALGTASFLPDVDTREDASITAPLPMLGGRLVYRLTPKWSIVGVSDVFFLNRGSQEGQLTDSHLFVEYKTDGKLTIGGGLNRFTLDLQLVDDDWFWDWSSVYTGAYLYAGFEF